MQLLQSMCMPILALPFWVGFSFVDLLCMSSISRNHESADAPTQRKPHWTGQCSEGGSTWSGKHRIGISMLMQMWCLYIIISLRKNSCSLFLYVVLHYYTRKGTASQRLPNRLVPGCILAGTLRFHACNAYSSKSTLWLLMVGIQQQYKCLKQPRWWNWLWRHQTVHLLSLAKAKHHILKHHFWTVPSCGFLSVLEEHRSFTVSNSWKTYSMQSTEYDLPKSGRLLS